MKNRITFFITLICPFLFSISLHSQDVGISSLTADTPDGFTLVALVDIPSTQNIFFTDLEWNPTTNVFEDPISSGNESTIRITWTGTWAKGTMIRVIENGSPFTVDVSAGGPTGAAATIVVSGDGFSISPGESYNVFTASNATSPDNTVTEVYTHVNLSTNSSVNPNDDPDCPCSGDFIYLNFNDDNVDNYDYTTSDREGINLAEFTNPANYLTSDAQPLIMSIAPVFTNLMFGGSGLLPIELASFKAKKYNEEVNIFWETLTETNNEYFSIEHSTDGARFESIGILEGAGDSFEKLSYSLIHKNPQTGLNYYRLKQVDFDEKFSYSNIEVVNFNGSTHNAGVIPNPFLDEIIIDLEKSFAKDTQFTIHDMMGRIVHTGLLEKDQLSTIINLSTLQAGVFILRIGNGENAISQRIIKQ